MANAVDWITLDNFTPGIYADFHGGVGGAARGSILSNGAAVIDGTYKCVADPSGSLMPLPKATTGQSSQLIPSGNASAGTARYPAGFPGAYLMDAVIQPLVVQAIDSDNTDAIPDAAQQVYTMWEFFYDPAATGNAYRQLNLGRVYVQSATLATSTRDFLWESSFNGLGGDLTALAMLDKTLLSANLELAHSQAAPGTGIPIAIASITTFIVGAVRRRLLFSRLSAIIPANELSLTTYDTDQGTTEYPSYDGLLVHDNTDPTVPSFVGIGTTHGFAFMAPHPSGAGTKVYVLPSQQYPQAIFTHQDRVGFLMRTIRAGGNGTETLLDGVFYTPPFDAAGLSYTNGAVETMVAGEMTSLCGVVASVSTDDLLMIKHHGGGLLMRGDLNGATVVRLRHIQPTLGISSTGVNTPLGFVYGSRAGVYLWGGGETTDKLSNQIDGFFWNHAVGGEKYEAHRARFGYLDPWVMVPNNYVFDTRSKSWWRIADPADRTGVPYNVYTTDPTSGNLLAFPYKLTATQNVVWDVLDPTVLSSNYSWRSQPIVETQDRVTPFVEVGLVASTGSNTAACTVTITLTGLNADGVELPPSTATFVFTGNGRGVPVVKHKALSQAFNAQYVQVRIEASAATGAAPKIHSVKLGKSVPRARNPIGNS